MTVLTSGELNRRITLQQRTVMQDSFGEPMAVWSNLASLWAGIQPLSGRELELAKKVSSEVTHRITIRYQASLTDTSATAALRLLYRNRTFNVHAVLNEEETNVLLHLLASEGLNAGG